MRQNQWGTSRYYPYVYGRPASGRCVCSVDGELLAPPRWASIPASPPAEPDPPQPPEPPPRTPEFPPDKEPPAIDDPPPDVVPVPVREPPSMPSPVALWLRDAAAGRLANGAGRRRSPLGANAQRRGMDWHTPC